MAGLRSVLTRHRRRLPVLIMHPPVVLATAPLVGVGLLLGYEDARLLALRLTRSRPVLWIRGCVALSRQSPRTVAP